MDFLTVDFEVASRYEYSPCSVAIYKFTESSYSKVYSTLINSGDVFFDPQLTKLHGITAEMVKDAPILSEVIKNICNIIQDQVLFAHNATYDIKKIINGCNECNINIPNFKYADSLMLAKRTWKGLINYKLDTVSNFLNIELNHHNADSDSIACGKIVLEAMKFYNSNDILSILEQIKYSYGYYKDNIFYKAFSHKLSKSSNVKSDYEKVKEIDINIDSDSTLNGKVIVFTGALSITREEAMKLAASCGAIPNASVTAKTNYLVVGNDDYNKFKLGNKSNKMIKAEQLIAKGQDLEMITEDDFLELIN